MRKSLASIFIVSMFFLFGCEKDIEQSAINESKQLSYKMEEYLRYAEDCDTADNNCTYVKFVYPKFDAANNPVADSLNKFVDLILLSSYEMQMYDNLDSVAQSIFADYNSVKADFEDYTIPWALEKNIEFNTFKNIATLNFSEYSYMGGAHPNSIFEYYNFDTATGKRLTVENFIRPGQEQNLLAAGENKFRELKEIPEEISLEAAGYWFENNRFYLAESFTVTDSGLVFIYNPYEIASYAEGFIELFLSNEELRGILK